ncbi:MAG: hypothetical protein V7644_1999 [Actinomycetota bacterium]|jgi:hypothetical protein
MSKKPHVPETREVRPNREQRRHPEKLEQPEDAGLSRGLPEDAPKQESQDAGSVRAKNTGHGKKTADKWNQ